MRHGLWLVVATAALFVHGASIGQGTVTQSGSAVPALFTLAPMVEAVTPGVVGISVSQSRSGSNPLMNDPAYREFFGEQDRKRGEGSPAGQPSTAEPVRPAGSGVIIDARQGLVITNHHVIQGSRRLVVVLKDRRELEAQLVGSDAGTDIALLRVKPERLTEVRVADSDLVRVGDFVVAIGNPFGIGQTVTSGIVSALGRGISPEGFEDYIQTDAPINPGNSGGALVNIRGELVGINTAILSGGGGPRGGGGNIGIGFAVPTSMAREVIAQILQFGEVRRGRIGIQVAEVTPALAAERGLGEIAGAVVSEIAGGSPAERAGIRVGDVVLRINGRQVKTGSDLRNRVALIPVGAAAEMLVQRGAAQSTLRVPVEAIVTAAAPAPPGDRPDRRGDGDATGRDPKAAGPGGPAVAAGLEGLQVAAAAGGMQVVRVTPGSPAHSVGFREGDVIVAIDRQPVLTGEALNALLARPGRKSISVVRGDSKLRFFSG